MPKHSHYPTGLLRKKVRGVLRFMIHKVDKKEFLFPIGTCEIDAIDTAIAYNQKYRNPLINVLYTHDPDNKPLKEWLEHIKERVKKEELDTELIGEDVFRTFCLDLERLGTLHGNVLTKSLSLGHVTKFLDIHTNKKSNNVYNAKIAFLRKVFSYLVDDGAIATNPALNKKKKAKPKKIRVRIDKINFKEILTKAPTYLDIAMRLSLQTTHAVNEISLAKYSDCTWLKESVIQNNLEVFGTLHIHRQKVKNKEASRVAIPITKQLKSIIDDSRKDNILSPYIVHRLKDARGKNAKNLTHPTQCRPDDISDAFSTTRDKLILYSTLLKDERPTFHEIRSLSIFLYDKSGINPQERAAHSDAKTTKKYKEGHIEWVQIQAAELYIDTTV